MRKSVKFIAVVAIAVIAMNKFGIKTMKKADFVEHQTIKTMNIGIDEIAMDQDACEEAAQKIIEDGRIEGMSKDAMAKEIYAHIFIHDVVESLPGFLQNNKFVKKAYNSTVNGIDLEDFGDTYIRQIAYNAIWVIGSIFG